MTDDQELTRDEANALADDLGQQLYRAEDRVAFVREMLTGRTEPVDPAAVLTWLDHQHCPRVESEQRQIKRLTTERDQCATQLAELTGAINWETSCLSCARTLDSALRETERAEKAEAELEENTGVLKALRRQRDQAEARASEHYAWRQHFLWKAIEANEMVRKIRELHQSELLGGIPTGRCASCHEPTPCSTRRLVPRKPDDEPCRCAAECPASRTTPDNPPTSTNTVDNPNGQMS